jgi:hypothetical protein
MTTVRAHVHMSQELGSGGLAHKKGLIGDRESKKAINLDIRNCEILKLEVPK